MSTVLNTLFVTTEGAYVHLDHETVRVEVEGKTQIQVPLLHLGGVACFGNIMMSPAALHRFADEGKEIIFFDRNGRFKARLVGPTTGNVLLRRAQHEMLSDSSRSALLARNVVAGKICNMRLVALRAARESEAESDEQELRQAATHMSNHLPGLEKEKDIDRIRGIEGDATRTYLGVFGRMVREGRDVFHFKGRSRRPPRDPVNALLSFLYAMLANLCISALEAVGLDPQVGYLHALRPGRPSLALDLMEEFRPILADRLALTLINRRQLSISDFVEYPGGAVHLNDKGRKEVIVTYQKRKQEEIHHSLLDTKLPYGLVPYAQARIMARYIREELEAYIPFSPR